MRLRRLCLLAIGSLTASAPTATAYFWSRWLPAADSLPPTPDPDPEEGKDPLIDGFPDFVDWFRSNGGTVDDRVTIGHEPGTSIRGMIATEPIPAGTTLIHTPGSIVLSSVGGDQCGSIQAIAEEMELGAQSKWHTYFEFDDSTGSRVPSQWDRSDGRAVEELQGLPPTGQTHRHISWYQSTCKKGDELTDLDWEAFLMYLTRAADIGLVPMYDLMNHHNGLINTKLQRDSDGGLYVIALTDIAAGEPIYNTYARSGLESTIDVFNTYGFVEDYPQLWRWKDGQTVDPEYDRDGPGYSDLNSEPYEILIVSPTVAALSPTKQLVNILGNGQRSIEDWQELIAAHHANLPSSLLTAVRDSSSRMLNKLPTTIEEDEAKILIEKQRLEKVKQAGRVDVNKADSIQAMEFRLAFKKALRMSVDVDVAEREKSLTDPLVDGFPNFVQWYRSNGGTIDDRVSLGYEPGTSMRGLIATAAIPADTILTNTPKSLILSSPDGGQCEGIEATIKELKLGAQSKWHTYFEFDDSAGSRIPSQWDRSNGGGRAMRELQGLPPSGETHRHINWYQTTCKKKEPMTDLDWRGLVMALTRAADIGLVPMYDLMNHHNGLINTKLQRDSDGGLSVVALTDIAAGEPMYLTYARAGIESTVDVFNTYGFVEDYPQLWRWNDQKLAQLAHENADHAYHRFGMSNSDANTEPGDRLRFEPNSQHYEILVIAPTLAALAPTKQLVHILGNGQRSLAEWQQLISAHHANLRLSHVNAVHDSAITLLRELPTTIEEDEALIPDEKRRLEKVKNLGREDVGKADAIQAMEYRLAFKKALRMAVDVAERENFFVDSEEL